MTARFTVRSFCTQKMGNRADEIEDACAPMPAAHATSLWSAVSSQSSSRHGRYAVADGATMSAFSGKWARLLVDEFVEPGFKSSIRALRSRANKLQRVWQEWVDHQDLPWYAAEKARFGALSTFLGLHLHKQGPFSASSGRWTAIAIGDSCLFQIRGVNLLTAFPLSRAEEFGQHPRLLSTRSLANRWNSNTVRTAPPGEWFVGDTFLLMTDALAEWFLKRYERADKQMEPWEELRRCWVTYENWTQWLDEQRTLGELRNDDVTLLVIEVQGNVSTPPST